MQKSQFPQTMRQITNILADVENSSHFVFNALQITLHIEFL